MHVFGAFELDVQHGTPDYPASIRVALLRYVRGEDGRLFITPECSSFEEIEGQLNSLQDELDEIRNEPVERSKSHKNKSFNCLTRLCLLPMRMGGLCLEMRAEET